ncbi:glycosyltransferase [Stieleria magnilauensis]|uniref:Undecaprenyl phosphate-alpha-4-amino-4-deoxy-L-arabinose arabinosyl transferase n=1 Tax=Stieleria magnilauensis TaxID=2527963 RepID=A0ABX5XUL6_9BACT|nr:Undecaprenyl phosphate-alpha-4-amino-4-deoxy-L-arabinose arabinosyl transferase [Planctomycetes bacterium TBK1r]
MHPESGTRLGQIAVSLVLPAWNEQEVIVRAIEEADAALREIANDYEIIVVDDGSTDDTAMLVEQAAQQNASVRLIRHNPNQGYGASLRSGFAAAEKDLVVFTDADCQFDLTELDRFVLLAERYDIVCGYRIDRKDTALRCLYSKVYNQLVRILLRTGVRDVDCALKMFHRDSLRNLAISGNGFLVNSEILTQAKQHELSVVEVGVSHRPRTDGTSTVSVQHIPSVLTGLARYWWNAVQFPNSSNSFTAGQGGPTNKDASSWLPDRTAGWLRLALLLVAAIFLLTNLGYPLIDRDETRYAEIPREMLATGNWVLPQLNFQTYYDKTPLLYWLCAISFQLFGVNETSARIVPALAALATIASTMWFGSRIFSKRIGLLSGVVLMLSVGFAFSSRYLLLDGVLSLFVTLSLFTAYESIRSGRIRMGWWMASAIFCGLGFLTKGPIAMVLWFPPVFAFAWLSQSYAKPRFYHYMISGLAVAAIAAPWLIAVSLQDGNFLTEFFYTHNVRRFAGEFHAKPIWFFVPVLLVAGHPWSFLTIPYARFLFGHSTESRSNRPPAVGFLLLWSAWCFVFFSLSKCKLPTYLLPAAPAMALMIGHYLDQILRSSPNHAEHWFARFWSARSATVATCTAGIGFVLFIAVSGAPLSPMTYAWAILWTGLLAATLLMFNDRRQAKLAWASSASVAFLLAVMVMHQTVPTYSRSQTIFGPDSPVNLQIATDSEPPIATIAHEFSGVPFYLNRSDVTNFRSVSDTGLRDFVVRHQRSVLIVDQRVTANQLREKLPLGVTVKLIADRGRASIVEVIRAQPSTQIAKRDHEGGLK